MPNPFSDKLGLKYIGNSGSGFAYFIYDISGRKVFTKGTFINDCIINTNALPVGNYLLEIVNIKSSEVYRKMVVKM